MIGSKREVMATPLLDTFFNTFLTTDFDLKVAAFLVRYQAKSYKDYKEPHRRAALDHVLGYFGYNAGILMMMNPYTKLWNKEKVKNFIYELVNSQMKKNVLINMLKIFYHLSKKKK